MNQENKNFSMNNIDGFKIAGLIILSIRFVQGWIFWGGGSRRFIYAPQKLDPYAAQWMANKLQSAMPGALLGVNQIVSFLLQHFILLYAAIIIFSLVELVSGIALIAGFFTRAAGFVTMLISILLMLLFGWQGGTCLDEWTMAVANLSIGLTLALSGGSYYSVDSWLMRRHPSLTGQKWFLMLASGPWKLNTLRRVSIVYLVFTILFTLLTYNYYRGAIFSPYHGGPVSPVVHHIALSNGRLSSNGSVTFTAYVNAGSAAVPSYIVRIELLNSKGRIQEIWEGKELSILPNNQIKNEYDYNRIMTGIYGIVASMSAKAAITLSPTGHIVLTKGNYQLQVYTIEGHRFTMAIHLT